MKVLSKEVNIATKFLEFVTTTYENTKGEVAKWCWVRRPNDTRAVVIACMVDDKLVITKEWRATIEGYEWGFPAGLIDPGESVETTVKRELKEETGLDLVDIMHISPAIVSSAGISDERIHIAFVKAEGTPNKDGLEASEDIETFLMDTIQVRMLIRSGNDLGKTAYPIMRYFTKTREI